MVAYSFKERFIAPITKGLGREFIEGWGSPIPVRADIQPKRQTIRAIGKRRHARAGEILQLYYGMRTKQCRSIGVARCVAAYPISMKLGKRSIAVLIDDGTPIGFAVVGDVVDDFAQADGFANADQMLEFWRKEHPGITDFKGVLIKWDPIHG
jgi:hypothetical protein